MHIVSKHFCSVLQATHSKSHLPRHARRAVQRWLALNFVRSVLLVRASFFHDFFDLAHGGGREPVLSHVELHDGLLLLQGGLELLSAGPGDVVAGQRDLDHAAARGLERRGYRRGPDGFDSVVGQTEGFQATADDDVGQALGPRVGDLVVIEDHHLHVRSGEASGEDGGCVVVHVVALQPEHPKVGVSGDHDGQHLGTICVDVLRDQTQLHQLRVLLEGGGQVLEAIVSQSTAGQPKNL